jgi:hypothetical protein
MLLRDPDGPVAVGPEGFTMEEREAATFAAEQLLHDMLRSFASRKEAN